MASRACFIILQPGLRSTWANLSRELWDSSPEAQTEERKWLRCGSLVTKRWWWELKGGLQSSELAQSRGWAVRSPRRFGSMLWMWGRTPIGKRESRFRSFSLLFLLPVALGKVLKFGPLFPCSKGEPKRWFQVSLCLFLLCRSLVMNRLHWLSYRWYVSWFTNTDWQTPPEKTPLHRLRRLPSFCVKTVSIFTLSNTTVKLRTATDASWTVLLKPRVEYLLVSGGESYTNQEDTCSLSEHNFSKFIQHFEFCSLQ